MHMLFKDRESFSLTALSLSSSINATTAPQMAVVTKSKKIIPPNLLRKSVGHTLFGVRLK